MVVGTSTIVVLEKKMQVADLVQQNRVIYDTCSVYFIQLLNGVFLFEVKAEHSVELLAGGSHATNEQNLRCADFH